MLGRGDDKGTARRSAPARRGCVPGPRLPGHRCEARKPSRRMSGPADLGAPFEGGAVAYRSGGRLVWKPFGSAGLLKDAFVPHVEHVGESELVLFYVKAVWGEQGIDGGRQRELPMNPVVAHRRGAIIAHPS